MSKQGDFMQDKCMAFSVRIVNLYKYLCKERDEYTMSKPLLRCGTSIAANMAEAQKAISKNDFLAKIYISLKECSETKYWIELLYKTEYLDEAGYLSINADCVELEKIINSTTKTIVKERNRKINS
jgi:four helix bundle protein